MSRHTPTTEFQQCINAVNKTLNASDISVVFNGASRKSAPNYNNWQAKVEALSWIDSVHGSDQKIVNELSDAQKTDESIGPVYNMLLCKDYVTGKKLKEFSRASQVLLRQKKNIVMENGVLVRKTGGVTQIVLPKCYHNLVYQELHEKLGHLGAEKAVELARKRFFWPYMQKDIEFYIKKRCRCIVSKKPSAPEKASLISINANSPFEMVSIDFLHLDRCKGGYEYALIICDHFTRYVQIFPTKNKSARSAADQIFDKYILSYGFPLRIHHDQGGNLTTIFLIDFISWRGFLRHEQHLTTRWVMDNRNV